MSETIDWKALAAEFPEKDVKWFPGTVYRSGDKIDSVQLFCYVDARDVMDRLDSVLTPAGWQCDLREVTNGFICGLSIRNNGEWITKWGGADATTFEGTKGAMSDALKRAAVLFGVARYLYHVKREYAEVSMTKQSGPGWKRAKHSDKYNKTEITYWWRRKTQGQPSPKPQEPPKQKTPDEIKDALLVNISQIDNTDPARFRKAADVVAKKEQELGPRFAIVMTALRQHAFENIVSTLETIKTLSDSRKISDLREDFEGIKQALGEDHFQGLDETIDKRVMALKDDAQAHFEGAK